MPYTSTFRVSMLDAAFAATTYLSLYTTNTSTELSVTRYLLSSAGWTNGSDATSNWKVWNSAIEFVDAPAATINGLLLYSAVTGGTLLASDAFAAPLTIPAGATIRFNSGDIKFGISQ
jgi:hypothetical protein